MIQNAHVTPFEYAKSKIGIHERLGTDKDDPFILECLRRCNVPQAMLHDETAWCAAFVGRCLEEGGKPRLRSASARAYLAYGLETVEPKQGDLVIFWRETLKGTKGHVALFANKIPDTGLVRVLGGNQNNQVGYKTYPRNRVLGYRTYI